MHTVGDIEKNAGFSHTNPSEDDKGVDISCKHMYMYSYFKKVGHTRRGRVCRDNIEF